MEKTAETTNCYRCEVEIRNGEPVTQGCVLVRETPGNFEEQAKQAHGDQVTAMEVQGTRLVISHPIKTDFGFEYYLYRPVLR